MRQSTLLFGQGPGRQDGGEGSTSRANEESSTTDQGRKRVRRAAASKSEERTKRQAQMTFAQNGHLQPARRPEEGESDDGKEVITVADNATGDEEEDVQPVRVKRREKAVVNGEAKPKKPISLTVRGTQQDPSAAVHSFFAKRPAPKDVTPNPPAAAKEQQSSAKHRWPLHKDASWPDSSNVHVQPEKDGLEAKYRLVTVDQLRKPERGTQGISALDGDGPSPWQYILTKDAGATTPMLSSPATTGVQGAGHISTKSNDLSPIDTKSCLQDGVVPPAIQRLSDEGCISKATSDNLLWTDRWRPTKSFEVLGNEGRAKTLRDWLYNLRVTADAAAQPVQRRVAKRRKKDKLGSMDDFMIDDEEEDEAWYEHYRKPDETSGLDLEQVDSTENRIDTGGNQDTLRNAILLIGPTGSGKTAAVYACAAELEFEVFEIYAGQGKRSGKEIGQAVGDLGRNHMVSSGGTGGGSTWKGFKEKGKLQGLSNGLRGAEAYGNTNGKAPRQSLILLEEVDLLFEEDKGFWTAVVELISTSRRPVVMTCNTVHSIPFEMICLQDTLYFEPPTEAVAVSYLQAMATCHGHTVSRELAQRLYRETVGSIRENRIMSSLTRPASGMIDPNKELASMDKTVRGMATFDLRQSIMQLQFQCQKGADGAANTAQRMPKMECSGHDISTPPASLRLRDAIRTSELHSFCDAFLSRSSDRQREIHEPDEYEHASRANDVHNASLIPLPKVRVKMECTTLAETGREEEYHEAILGNEEESIEVDNAGDLMRTRRSAILLEIMASLSVPASHQVPSDCVVIDYAPMIDLMIRIDDAEQAVYYARLKQAAHDIQMQRTASEEGKAEALLAAQRSLFEIGIRPSRQSTRMLLERGDDGLLALGKRDTAPYRWIEMDAKLLQEMRDTRLHFD